MTKHLVAININCGTDIHFLTLDFIITKCGSNFVGLSRLSLVLIPTTPLSLTRVTCKLNFGQHING